MRQSRLFWGVVILLIGLLLLLDNFGVLSFLNVSVGALVFPLMLIALGAWVLWMSMTSKPGFETEELAIPLEGVEEAHVTVEYGAGELSIQGTAKAGELLSGTFDGVRHRVTCEGQSAKVRLESPSMVFAPFNFGPAYRRVWSFGLSSAIPLSLTVKTGASDNKIDLRDLKVSRLRLETGASSTRLTLPAHAGYTEVRGSSGAASLTVDIPEGVAARIRTGGGLSDVKLDRNRFPRTANANQSPDYETAENKVDLYLEMGVGSITIR
jgi:hypothetical protein